MSHLMQRGPVTVLDLDFQGVPGTVGAFLVKTPAGPALVETGPESLFPNLKARLEAAGHAVEEVRHVFVTHIHLDHAGAAWRLARHGAKVYVHPKGAAHLVDPGKLLASAQRIYQDDMDRLWGGLEPIPADQVVAVEDGQAIDLGGLKVHALHTPGHAVHHITWRVEDGLFTGDVGGIRLGNGPVIPPLPPPDIHLEDWAASNAKMRATGATAIYPTHFGIHLDAAAHFDSLDRHLADLSAWMKDRLEGGAPEEALVPPFQAHLDQLLEQHGLDAQARHAYETADPAFMSVYGLARYWRKRSVGA